ncbi:hypothetical protein VQH23_08095 [Pararoseomonas sp. SCSIO 73927]|uniref:hypothetical protein n=1 Tax=Pararoseomonas sp. SCSIO 73927 TaxID=3114537 RepID=UPI0030D5A142
MAMGLWAVRPLLEEWGLFAIYASSGLSYLLGTFSVVALRPLHLTPSALQWILGGGQVWGVGVVAALLLATRYAVARWAVAPVLPPVQRWAFATACTVLVGWPALWLGRFHPAQFSATLFFVLLGCGLRLCIRNTVLPHVMGALSLCALLMTYQAVALLVCTIPFLAGLWVPPGKAGDMPARLRRGARSAIMVATGFALYALYVAVIYATMDGVYELALAAGVVRSNPVALLLGNIATVYGATFGRSPEILGLLMALLCAAASGPEPRRGRLHALLGSLAVLLLPLLSLTYILPAHLQDPERAMFPIACGATVLLLALLMVGRPGRIASPPCILLVAALLASGAASAHQARARWNFQKDIGAQVANLARTSGAGRILLRDETGLLGDVYTYLGNTLSEALLVLGVRSWVNLCTPDGVDRIHPDALRYPIATTPRCAAPAAQDTLVAVARMQGGKVVIERAPPGTAGQ